MDSSNLEKKVSLDEQKAREILNNLFEKEDKSIDDLNEIHCLIEDYLEQGYKFREYIGKYNKLVAEFKQKRS